MATLYDFYQNEKPLDRKDSIQVALKEYDGLRKEIDARTDGTRTYAWPVVLLAGTTLVGWKVAINLDLVFFLIPLVALIIFVLATNAAYDMDKARKALARVENRIFILSGETLLTHESCRVIEWQSGALALREKLLMGTYLWWVVEVSLYFSLNIDKVLEPLQIGVLALVAATLTGWHGFNIQGWYELKAREFDPPLPLLAKVRSKDEVLIAAASGGRQVSIKKVDVPQE